MDKYSEALKGLESICKILKEKYIIDIKWVFKNEYNKIEQALLKAQEQEKRNELLNGKAKKYDELVERYVKLETAFENMRDEARRLGKETQRLRNALQKKKGKLRHYSNCKKENQILKEIIKSLFDRGCPLHQYNDIEFGLTIEVDNECSIMHLGKFKDVDLDKKLKEVLGDE